MRPILRNVLCSMVLLVGIDALHAQSFSQVPFPSTDETAVSDCGTPTTLTLNDGSTITLRGGHFIHYEDENFFGTMYATSSAAGCTHMPPDMDVIHRPTSEITITFSKPMPLLQLNTYNLNGPPGSLEGPGPGMGVSFWDANGGGISGSGRLFPSHQMLPDPFEYPTPGPGQHPPVTTVSLQSFTEKMQPDFTFTPTDWFWGITLLRVVQGAPDFVKFDFTGGSDGKILLSKAAWDIGFPSKYQLPSTGGVQRVKIAGTLISGSTKQPKAGKVYLRVDDPPDTASYRFGDARDGDNDGFLARFSGAADNGILMLQTDSQGRFEATLGITSHTAGDNYQIAGAPNEQFECGGGACPKSGVFTLWKRVYVEEEHMFRQGSFIADVVAPGDTAIAIDDPVPFRGVAPGDILELVHADSGGGEGFYSENVTFRAVAQRAGQWYVDVDPSAPVARRYGAPPNRNPIDPILRDGVGITASGVYEPNDSFSAALFAAAFVELMPARQAIAEAPYLREITDVQRGYYASRWLQDGIAISVYSRHANPNVHHRIGASQAPLVSRGGGIGAQLGLTTVNGGSNSTFILIQRIEDIASGRLAPVGAEYQNLPPAVINGETTTHETVHFWVHAGGADGAGHCVEVAYQGTLNCLMHTPYAGPGLADGAVDLHYAQHGADSEYMTIRRAADPVPLQ